jgi:hypothetical protein
MNAFESREKALEQIYFLDSEMAFRVRSRRDRLLARWVCTMLGAADSEAYVGQIIDIRIAGADDEGVITKIFEDLRSAGKDIDRRVLRERMEMMTADAMRDLARPV